MHLGMVPSPLLSKLKLFHRCMRVAPFVTYHFTSSTVPSDDGTRHGIGRSPLCRDSYPPACSFPDERFSFRGAYPRKGCLPDQ